MSEKEMKPEDVLLSRMPVVADGLRAMLRNQELVDMIGAPRSLEPSQVNIMAFMLAATEEIHEFGRELNWRPWHSPDKIDEQKAMKEYGDILAFVLLLGIYLMKLGGVNADDIARVYTHVSIKNMKDLVEKAKAKDSKMVW